jgi:hypothetical protein
VDGWKPECCLGILEDRPWQQRVYSVAGPGSKDLISDAASLKEIICGNRSISPRQKYDTRPNIRIPTDMSRCTLALTLASSVLQLHDTPWLPQSWETKDIFLLKSHSGTTIPSEFYVSRTFTSSPAAQAIAKRCRIAKNDTIFALGVALLELAHGAPVHSLIDKSKDLNDEGNEDSTTPYLIASRLAQELNNYESENYAKAVLRCVNCNFDTFTFSFDDSEFRAKFYEGVVVPLQEDYEHVTGGKSVI